MSVTVDPIRTGSHPKVWEVLSSNTTVQVSSNLSTATVTDSFTIPGGTLKVGDTIRMRALLKAGLISGTPANFFARLYLGATGQLCFASLSPTSSTAVQLESEILVTGTNSQIAYPALLKLNTTSTGSIINTTEAISGEIDCNVNINFNDVLQELTQYWFRVELLRA